MPYSSSVYNLEQTLGLTGPTTTTAQYELFNSANTANHGNGYILIPTGQLYAWTGSYASSVGGAVAAVLTPAFFQNPSFLTDPSPTGVLSAVSTHVASNMVTVSDNLSASGFVGTTVIAVTANNSIVHTFDVTFKDVTPVWTAPGNQSVSLPGSTSTGALPLSSTDSAGNTLHYAVQIGGYSSLFNIEQQYALAAPPGATNYILNARGYHEEVSGQQQWQ